MEFCPWSSGSEDSVLLVRALHEVVLSPPPLRLPLSTVLLAPLDGTRGFLLGSLRLSIADMMAEATSSVCISPSGPELSGGTIFGGRVDPLALSGYVVSCWIALSI